MGSSFNSTPVVHITWTADATGHTNTSSSGNTTGADLLTVVLATYSGVFSSNFVSDNKGNTFVNRGGYTFSDTRVEIFDCVSPTVGTGHTFTAGNSGGDANFFYADAMGWQGSYTSGSSYDTLSAGGGNNGGGGTVQPGSVTPANDGSLIVAGLCTAGTPVSIDSSFSIIDQNAAGVPTVAYGFAAAALIQGAKTAVNPTWSGLVYNNAASQAVYRPASYSSGSITGDAAWTEAQDIWSGAGAVAVDGSAAWTEAKDIWAGVGALTSSGPAAWTEAPDIWAAAGTVASGITGSASWTEAQDTWAGAGAVAIDGSASWTETQDIWAGVGSITLPTVTGTAAWTEAQDSWAGIGSNGAFDLLDTGKKTKKVNKARDKAIKEERERNAKRRQLIREAFARTFEGKIPMSEEVAQELVNAVQTKQETIPNAPNFEAMLANLSNIEALWRDYLDRDDEEVLVLL